MNYKIQHESWEEASFHKRYNRGLKCVVNFPTYSLFFPLFAGTSDDIEVYTAKELGIPFGEYFVLAKNDGLNYLGVEVFSDTGEKLHEFFTQDADSFKENSGVEEDEEIIKIIADYL